MNMIAYKLKGCDARSINKIVHKKLYLGEDITNDISIMVSEILSLYTINDCVSVIMNRADIHDAYIKYYNRTSGEIDTYNKLQFHRELVFYYVNEIVNMKIDEKIMILSSSQEPIECVICLEEIKIKNKKTMIKTVCNHTFHINCLMEWKRRCNTCPLCRIVTI